jgi:NAD-dependent SIR2 family protein deacetylase
MRFIPGTPDIPDQPIKDVLDGHAVFHCGAGVSRRVGMPSFGELTDQIYGEIGETPNNEAAAIVGLFGAIAISL